jgi:serine/threonine protein kinase
MDENRWQRVEQLYHGALEQPPEGRSEYLSQACGDDEDLRREIEELLAYDGTRDKLIDRPAWEHTSGVPATRQLAAGTLLGPYRVLRPLGAGGMGSVYLAEDTRLQRNVALKFLRSHAPTELVRQRLQREARLISSLNHPNICALYDIGAQDGTDFLVMEYIEGETLGSRVRKAPLTAAESARMAAQVADALHAAHSKDIIHRDLKPDNIMLTASGVKVLDFGLAKLAPGSPIVSREQNLTGEGAILGTPAYMSPEQLQGRKCDTRTDVFGLGLVLYEAVTGRRAFDQDTQADLIVAIMTSEPDLSVIRDPGLREILRGCLTRDPEQRFPTAIDVKKSLDTLRFPDRRSSSLRAWARPWVWIAAAFLPVMALLAGIYSFRRHQPSSAASLANSRSDLDPAGPKLQTIGEVSFVPPYGWTSSRDPGGGSIRLSIGSGSRYAELNVYNTFLSHGNIVTDFRDIWETLGAPRFRTPPPNIRDYKTVAGYSGQTGCRPVEEVGQVCLFVLRFNGKVIPIVEVLASVPDTAKYGVDMHLFLEGIRVPPQLATPLKNTITFQEMVGEWLHQVDGSVDPYDPSAKYAAESFVAYATRYVINSDGKFDWKYTSITNGNIVREEKRGVLKVEPPLVTFQTADDNTTQRYRWISTQTSPEGKVVITFLPRDIEPTAANILLYARKFVRADGKR